MQRLFVICLFMVIVTTFSAVAQPARDQGLSLHMLPERVANLSKDKGGFTVSAPAPKMQIAAMNANGIMQYFQHLPAAVQKNGIWIVFTDPASYTDSEKGQLKMLVADCQKQSIPIFTCRAYDLKRNGWKAGGLME